MKRMFIALALTIGALALGGTAGATPATVLVTPHNMQGWAFFDDNGHGGVGQMANGPASPPLGSGSAELAVSATNQGYALGTGAYAGTPLTQITNLGYSSYQPGPTLAIALQFDVKLVPADTHYDGRLVFEPYQNGHVTVGSGWQHWSPLGGIWWASHSSSPLGAGGSGGLCPIGNPCTWSTILSDFPGATISGAVVFKAGSGWSSFDGNVDNFTIGVNGSDTTYDFEPETPCTTTCYVNTATGSNSFGGDTPASAKKTIQAAVSQVSPGGTVIVAAGSYPAAGNTFVVLNKPITLLGAQAGVDARTRGPNGIAGMETVMPTTGGPYIFDLASPGITIDGFDFANMGPRGFDSYANVDNLTISDNIFKSTTGTYSGGNIQLGGGYHANNFTFERNYVQNDNGYMLYLGHAMTGGTIADNYINGDSFSFGPFGAPDGWTISGNEFDGNVPGYGAYWGYGINGAFGNAVIENNYVHQMSIGLGQFSLIGGTVSGNTFDDNQYAAFQLWGGEYGTPVSTNDTIANNLIEYDGVACTDYTDASHGIRLRPGLDATTIHLHDNSFVDLGLGGCGQAWAIRQDGSGAADATNNWWGQSTGPAAGQIGDGAVTTAPYIVGYIDDPAHLGQLGFWPLIASPLNAGKTVCSGIYGGTGKDVVVPDGATCTLVPGTQVTHDVNVGKGSTLIDNGATIGHDLHADKSSAVTVEGGSIGHDVQVQNSSGNVTIENASIGHDLHVEKGDGAVVIDGNTVGHDLVVQNNDGPVTVDNNVVTHDINVQHNGTPTEVSGDSAGHDAKCEKNDGQTGSGNTAGNRNSCPA